MKSVVTLYQNHGRKIFPSRLPSRIIEALPQLLTRPWSLRSGEKALRVALDATFGSETLGDLYARRNIAISIPAVEMSRQRAWVFKTSHLGGHRDEKSKIADICMATSAAPLYRSLAAIDATIDDLGGHLVFADGGLWANNPVLVGMIDALQMCSADRPIEIFALGTCPRQEGESIGVNDVHRGLLAWKFGGKALQLGLSAQEYAFDEMARLLAGVLTKQGRPVTVTRFPNGDLPADALQYLDIDDTREEAMTRLVGQARTDVSITKSACDDIANLEGQLIARLMRDLPEINGGY